MKRNIDKSVARRTLRYYWRELKRHKLLSVISIASQPFEIFFMSFAVPYIIAQVIDALTTQTIASDQIWTVFGPYIWQVAGAAVLGLAIQTVCSYAGWAMMQRAERDLYTQTFDTLLEQSMHFHNNRFGGSLVSQTHKYVSAFSTLFGTLWEDIIPITFSILFTVVLLWPISWQFIVVLLVFIAIYTVISYVSYKKILQPNIDLSVAANDGGGQLADSVSNISAVKSYGREDFERKRYGRVVDKIYNCGMRVWRLCLRRDNVYSVVIVGITVAMMIFMVGGNSWLGISVGSLVLIFTYTNQILSKLWGINNVFRRVNRGLGDAYEMTLILDEPRSVVNKPDAKALAVTRGAIEFDHIDFQYADGNEDVFRDLTIKIKSGQRVGFVGHSGSGKTTITKLLLRFADVTDGAILIDGQDIRDVTQESLRHGIAYVPQETNLFHRSIAENIAYGRPKATREEIIRAAKLANAWEFIERLPQGLETLVGERGVKLSGGQRQRVAIARAILKDAPILVLDEATSALDTESEKLIQAALHNLMHGRTSVVIAHRLSTVAELDRIIVLDEGRVIEDGRHADLIKSDGKYARLWNKQTGLER
ncbi:MAG: ABC transporter ATP-binding protein/permease [Candidatus Nomurabacteria bacterium]|jgi:ATP-binding cassette subfamily B protein|nr:ABC transporter ATP-binding protein/permease [Candidatus Nomurabacteria bacterium]